MKTILIILAVVTVVALVVIKLIKVIKADIEADEAFAAKYGKFVGQEVWRISFVDDRLFDDQKKRITDLDGFNCQQRSQGTLSEFFPCKITDIARNYDKTLLDYHEEYKGKIKTVPLAFEADFEIKYISKSRVFLYSEKYGELQIDDEELYEALKKYTSPTVRLKCDPWILSDEERKQNLNLVDFIIFWEIV